MDLNFFAPVPVSYSSWHVVTSILTTYLSVVLLLLALRGVLVKVGFYYREPPSFARGLNATIIAYQAALFGWFLYALVLSFGAIVNPPSEKQLWTEYSATISPGTAGAMIAIGGLTIYLAIKGVIADPAATINKHEFKLGILVGGAFMVSIVLLSAIQIFFLRSDYQSNHFFLMATTLASIGVILFGTSRNGALASRMAMVLALSLAMNMLTTPMVESLILRYEIPKSQLYLSGLIGKIEQQRTPDGHYPRELDCSFLATPKAPFLVRRYCRSLYFGYEDHYQLYLPGSFDEGYSYSSRTKKWSAQKSGLWH